MHMHEYIICMSTSYAYAYEHIICTNYFSFSALTRISHILRTCHKDFNTVRSQKDVYRIQKRGIGRYDQTYWMVHIVIGHAHPMIIM